MSGKFYAKLRTSVKRSRKLNWSAIAIFPALVFMVVGGVQANSNGAHDPGVRGGPPGAGTPIAGLTPNELTFFSAGLTNFEEIDSVTGSVPNTGNGLGPRFNGEGCAQCHAQPATGGTSPFTNPQVAAATDQGATNQVPFFISISGPIREARFPYLPNGQPDGGVHNLFTITGRTDAPGCNIQQPNFAQAQQQNNLIFRIPTPVFGDGLIEEISDATITANMNSNLQQKRSPGNFRTSRIPAPMMARLPALAGRRRTNRWECLPAKPITWKSVSPTKCSPPSAIRRQAANSTPRRKTARTSIWMARNCPATSSASRPSSGCWTSRSRVLAPPQLSVARRISRRSAALCVTRNRCRRDNRPLPGSAMCRQTCFPTCYSITWDRVSPTMSAKAPRAAISSAPLRCGDWGSASSFSMMAGAQIWCRPFKPTAVTAIVSIRALRPTVW